MTEFVVEQVSYGMCPSMSEGMPHSHTKKCCMYAYTQRGVCCTYTMRCCRSMHTKRRPLHIVHKEVLPARTHKETFVAHRTQRCCRSIHTKRRLLHIVHEGVFIHTKRRLLHIVHKGVAGSHTHARTHARTHTRTQIEYIYI